MQRSARLVVIRGIIESRKVDSQEMLLKLLKEQGFDITQATLSRDLKYLKAGKVPDGRGGYSYAFYDAQSKAGSDKSLLQDIMMGYLSFAFSGNLGVIKTLPGHAGSVAFALDNLGIDKILATLAGDDTILLVPGNNVSRDELIEAMAERIPGLKDSIL
ncbi:MAG TPA: ArgR family transcriptional regulator [Spirochaetales bacterium]|nr:ArgR family transcriptional regulator [Spirochaetales bacterium]